MTPEMRVAALAAWQEAGRRFRDCLHGHAPAGVVRDDVPRESVRVRDPALNASARGIVMRAVHDLDQLGRSTMPLPQKERLREIAGTLLVLVTEQVPDS